MQKKIIVNSVLKMCRLLNRHKQDMEWAAKVCQVSRQINIDIWKDNLSREYVKRDVVVILYRASQLLIKLRDSGRDDIDQEKLQIYALNVMKRLVNTGRYLNKQSPNFPPADKLLPLPDDTQDGAYSLNGILCWVVEIVDEVKAA